MPQTIVDAFRDIVERRGCQSALQYKVNGQWIERTWQQLWEEAWQVASGFLALGLERGERIAILSRNRREWHSTQLAAGLTGAVVAGLYADADATACQQSLVHCDPAVIIVENPVQLSKIYPACLQLPHLRAVVFLEGRTSASKILSWHQLLRRGRGFTEPLMVRSQQVEPDDLAVLAYAAPRAGASSPPRAVMLSHDNLLWLARTLAQPSYLPLTASDRYLSLRPLANVSEQVAAIFLPLCTGHRVCIGEGGEEAWLDNLRDTKPSLLWGTPEQWQRLQEKIGADPALLPVWGKQLLAWASPRTSTPALLRPLGERLQRLSQRLLASPLSVQLRQQLGLDRCRYLVSCNGALPASTQQFYEALGLPLYYTYGRDECTGITSFTDADGGGFAQALPGTDLALAADDLVLVHGRHVFRGYWQDTVATARSLQTGGWLATADRGRLTAEGRLELLPQAAPTTPAWQKRALTLAGEDACR